jgi:hypothetical protein
VLLLLYLYNRPVLDLLGTEDIAAEVVRTLSSAIGLVLAVPVTTAIAALTVSAGVEEELSVDAPFKKKKDRSSAAPQCRGAGIRDAHARRTRIAANDRAGPVAEGSSQPSLVSRARTRPCSGFISISHPGLVEEVPRPCGVRFDFLSQLSHVEPKVALGCLVPGPPYLDE